MEAFIEGKVKRLPSGQLRISPLGDIEPVSTHEQLTKGPDQQVYAGCEFPAEDAYRGVMTADCKAVGEALRQHHAVGRFGVDFLCVQQPSGAWDRYAIEINLRLGGTTHPMMLLQMMTHGTYQQESGLYLTRRGEAQYYRATDSLPAQRDGGLLPEDLLDVAALSGLHYQPWDEAGVLFHMLGRLSEFGRVGITAIGKSRKEAKQWFERTAAVLSEESE